MDDGSRDGKGLRLYTNNFTLDDVQRLKRTLKNLFDLNCEISHINKKRNFDQYKLYIRKDSMDKLRLLVKDYILPSMYYKIGLPLFF